MGGRGKTPLVAYIARLLLEAGERPAILSRGYGRRRVEAGVVVVSDGVRRLADLDRSGDEPLMLARTLPGVMVFVSESRSMAAALASRVFDATVCVLDDGFQHRALARDTDIVIVTPADLQDRRVPFGRLREPVSALARADLVVADAPAPFSDPRVHFTLSRAIGEPIPLDPAGDAADRSRSYVALAGIAGPDRFRSSLVAAGWRVAELIAPGDHRRYTPRDIERVASAVRQAGCAGVLTTEKDAVRLRALRPLPVPVFVVPLAVAIDPAEAFRARVLARVHEARR
jgi:tetraacyldisaccharide 4'-kinase